MNDQQLVATACPIIADLGSSFYWAPGTSARGAEFGLDVVQFYAMGRGGVLGDVEPAVISSAFGYFNPGMVAALWYAGREKVAPRVAGSAYMECCAEHGRSKLGEIPALAQFVAAGEKVLAACNGDSLALFAGVAAEPAATEVSGRAMQLVTILREYRGSAHLAAIRVVGLASKDAHFVKRPNDIKLFGWSDADTPVIDDVLLAKVAEAEALTDRMVTPAYSVLDGVERAAFVEGLTAIQAALTT